MCEHPCCNERAAFAMPFRRIGRSSHRNALKKYVRRLKNGQRTAEAAKEAPAASAAAAPEAANASAVRRDSFFPRAGGTREAARARSAVERLNENSTEHFEKAIAEAQIANAAAASATTTSAHVLQSHAEAPVIAPAPAAAAAAAAAATVDHAVARVDKAQVLQQATRALDKRTLEVMNSGGASQDAQAEAEKLNAAGTALEPLKLARYAKLIACKQRDGAARGAVRAVPVAKALLYSSAVAGHGAALAPCAAPSFACFASPVVTAFAVTALVLFLVAASAGGAAVFSHASVPVLPPLYFLLLLLLLPLLVMRPLLSPLLSRARSPLAISVVAVASMKGEVTPTSALHSCTTNRHAPWLPSGSLFKLYPAESALQQMSVEQLRTLPRFIVEYPELGFIEWVGSIDVRDIGNVEEVVSFQVL